MARKKQAAARKKLERERLPEASPRAIEARRRALARKAKADRAERTRAFRSRVKATRAGAAAAGAAASTRLTLLAEGDSWFDYPIPTAGDVIVQLQNLVSVDVLNLAHYGDEVRDMMGVEQRQRLRAQFSNPTIGFDALLFSGGGNDLVGDPFCLWVRDRAAVGGDVARGIDIGRLDSVLGIVEAGYRDLIALRDALAPQCVIFAHAYDFPRATGKGVCGIGPWLKPSLVFRGWTDPAEQFEIVKAMLRRFDQRLVQLEQSASNGSFVYVRTQGTLDPDQHRGNEIHPNRLGFKKIAERFRDALAARFPGRV